MINSNGRKPTVDALDTTAGVSGYRDLSLAHTDIGRNRNGFGFGSTLYLQSQ